MCFVAQRLKNQSHKLPFYCGEIFIVGKHRTLFNLSFFKDFVLCCKLCSIACERVALLTSGRTFSASFTQPNDLRLKSISRREIADFFNLKIYEVKYFTEIFKFETSLAKRFTEQNFYWKFTSLSAELDK